MKICIISGSRSEFDLLRNLIVEIKKDRFFNSKLLITGSHLSKFFGNTVFDSPITASGDISASGDLMFNKIDGGTF